ncbi:unnamed protein product, partial [Ectocarpus sp. 12 AP-2014]
MRTYLHILRSIPPFIDGGCRNYIYIKQGKISPTKEPASYASASHGDRDTTIRGGGKQTTRKSTKEESRQTITFTLFRQNPLHETVTSNTSGLGTPMPTLPLSLASEPWPHRVQRPPPTDTSNTADQRRPARKHTSKQKPTHQTTPGRSVGWLVHRTPSPRATTFFRPSFPLPRSAGGGRSPRVTATTPPAAAAAAAAVAGRVRPRPPEPSTTTSPSCANATPPVAAPESTSRTTWSTRDSRLEEPPLSPALAGRCCSSGLWPWPCNPAGGGRSDWEAASGGQAASPSAATTAGGLTSRPAASPLAPRPPRGDRLRFLPRS